MEIAVAGGAGLGALAAALGLGLRHGLDWDHIAAITDITSSQDDDRRALGFSVLYSLGHALVVAVLGVAAVVAGRHVPGWLDAAMGRVVGATLVALGVYVLWSLVRHGRDARMRSRWMLAIAGTRRAWRRLRARGRRGGPADGVEVVEVAHDHEHPATEPHGEPLGPPAPVASVAAVAPVAPGPSGSDAPGAAAVAVRTGTHRHPHVHRAPMPDDPFATYGRGTSFLVGMLHGVGAETPTQVLIFVTAAGAGGAWAGVTLLAAFVVGLVLSNTAVALASRLGVLNASRNFAAYAGLSVVVAVLSLALGTALLLDAGEVLPPILG